MEIILKLLLRGGYNFIITKALHMYVALTGTLILDPRKGHR